MVPAAGAPITTEEIDDYRWQLLAADAVSLGLLLKGGQDGARVGALTYVLAAPIIHLAHDSGGRAAASVALRLGLPVAGALTGVALAGDHRCDDDDCEDEAAVVFGILGFGAGILSAMVVDAAFVARPIHRSVVTWAPQIAVTRQHVGLGIVGRF